MTLPRITIITPSFNQVDYIEETICSVLDQNYPNLDYILIDGGSTDGSIEIIKKYQKHLSYWVSEPDGGQSDALVKGYHKSTGDVINWLNSDDYYQPGALKIIGDAFTDHTINVYCGKSRIFGDGIEYHSNGTDLFPDNLEKTIGWARIDQPETFMRKSIWDNIGPVNRRFHYVMDKDLWLRYLLTYGLQGVVKTDELLANFRLHDNSKTMSQSVNFTKETIDLYFTLARSNNLDRESNFLKDNFQAKEFNINYNYPNRNVEKIVNYFFYRQLLEAYALDDIRKFNLLKDMVRIDCLESSERKHLRNIKLRFRVIPQRLKKLWNNL